MSGQETFCKPASGRALLGSPEKTEVRERNVTVRYEQVREERAVSGEGQNGRRMDKLAVSMHKLDVGTRSPAISM